MAFAKYVEREQQNTVEKVVTFKIAFGALSGRT